MKARFILPFDHRSTFVKSLLGFSYPPNKAQARQVMKLKKIVWDGFVDARKKCSDKNSLMVLIDEEFGRVIIKKAKRLQVPVAVSTEKSGQDLFEFQYGEHFGEHLLRINPAFAKALVRYNPAQTVANKKQLCELKKLSDFCKKQKIGLMVELLMRGKGETLTLLERSIKQIQKADITPTVWKVEGLEKARDWKRINALTDIDIIVLGRGEAKKDVELWLTQAAKSKIVDGFAVGRTVFFKPLQDYLAKRIDRKTAVSRISKNYLHFIRLWEKNCKTFF